MYLILPPLVVSSRAYIPLTLPLLSPVVSSRAYIPQHLVLWLEAETLRRVTKKRKRSFLAKLFPDLLDPPLNRGTNTVRLDMPCSGHGAQHAKRAVGVVLRTKDWAENQAKHRSCLGTMAS